MELEKLYGRALAAVILTGIVMAIIGSMPISQGLKDLAVTPLIYIVMIGAALAIGIPCVLIGILLCVGCVRFLIKGQLD